MKRIYLILIMTCSLFFNISYCFTDFAYSQTGPKKTVYSEKVMFEVDPASLGIKTDSAIASAGPLSALGCFAVMGDRTHGDKALLYSAISHSFYIFSMSGELEKNFKLNWLSGYGPQPVFSDVAVSPAGKIYAYDLAGDRFAVFNGDLAIIRSASLGENSGAPSGIYTFLGADNQGNIRAYDSAASVTAVFSGDTLEKKSAFKGFVSSFSPPPAEEKNIYFAEYSENIIKFMEAVPGEEAHEISRFDCPAEVKSVYFMGGRGDVLYFLAVTLDFDRVVHTIIEIGRDKKNISGVQINLQQDCLKPLKIIVSPSGRLLFLKKKGEKYAVIELKKSQVLE
ncbi:MAG TPA: hypothetical protein PKK26_13980 [Candidatus Wallbacteria bacterium]|nr:hypothetical protein [Candidatus Wallbacteria bacterium]